MSSTSLMCTISSSTHQHRNHSTFTLSSFSNLFSFKPLLTTIKMSVKTLLLSSVMAAMASAANVAFVNNSGQDIPYVVIGQEGQVVAPATLGSGGSVQLPVGPDNDGYSLKMGAPGSDPNTFTNSIFQFEYVANAGTLSYDMSCNNCFANGPPPAPASPNQDPLINFTRAVAPGQPNNGGRCIPFTIGPNDDFDVNNVYPPDQTQPPQSALGTCNLFDGVVVTFTVSA
nr:hypothetical protein CFP56_44275 [Quercus suber]